MKIHSLLLTAVLMITPGPSMADTTTVSVHVISRGAKFVGSSMGGARVTLENADTGEVLAQGITEGDTGDTKLIMRTPHRRGKANLIEGAAGFSAELELREPLRVRASAYGPLDYPQAANAVSATRWLLPGTAYSGPASLILELPGLVVDIHVPSSVVLEDDQVVVPVRARVTMMCGCEITADGLWEASEFEVQAQLMDNNDAAQTVRMMLTGEPSEFAGQLVITQPGRYHVSVLAHQSTTGNSGMSQLPVTVRPVP